jgi:hypothetical protein
MRQLCEHCCRLCLPMSCFRAIPTIPLLSQELTGVEPALLIKAHRYVFSIESRAARRELAGTVPLLEQGRHREKKWNLHSFSDPSVWPSAQHVSEPLGSV